MITRRTTAFPRRPSRRLLIGFLLGFLIAGAAPRLAMADAVDDAKAAGLVGERADGYLGLVTGSAPTNVVGLVKSTNAKRKAAYAQIAADAGTTPDAVGQIAAQKLYAKAPPGTFLQAPDGSWKQK